MAADQPFEQGPVAAHSHGHDSPLSLSQALLLPRIAIEAVSPVLEAGAFAVKGLAGRTETVDAKVFADGHDKLAVVLRWRRAGSEAWHSVSMQELGNDSWQARFTPEEVGRYLFCVEAWKDEFATYRYELEKKYAAGVNVELELEEGRLMLQGAQERGEGNLRQQLRELHDRLASLGVDEKVALLLGSDTRALMALADHRPFLSKSPEYPLEVERSLAEFASWYELFPRSITDDKARHGTFNDVHARLPMIRDMGFDVLYFPPIHPIGRAHRKGPNNSLTAGPDDVGSPYAIGSADGGHEAIHPQLGTREDFRRLVKAAAEHGLEIALDFAIQCSQDHLWLKEHPGWFSWRPDGTIRYAENPPKKYQDIVNVDFYAADAVPSLWLALRDVVWGWVQEGVKIFRVDNPHTKPLPFWQWLIDDIRTQAPEVMFLAEAFTKPAMMARLGKVGYSQSYTYFTWRNTKAELSQYFAELNEPPLAHCYRPNFFVNTPDINPYFLHESGRPGFLLRAALATMGSGLWGMYSGFELCESAAVPGKEEYLDSEKYEIRPRDFTQPGNIIAEIAQLNRIRRQNPALQTHLGFTALPCWNDQILYFAKRTPDRSNYILVAVSLDPHNAQEAHFELPLWELGLADDAATHGEDLMNGHTWTWYGKTQFMRIEPWHLPFGIWRITAAPEIGR
ncbi:MULTISPECIES: alpha-1,4-glucan--maltose-1-phosphate maltosyltransferase [unclassified Pseudomonas]|uniref:alpha-1,4-glucan--maltose-1-phosphate maltosyltransferase n=1 Tax=unclassified Pseudomonas TaxID=196821 RepID=UPI000BDBA1C7|nr:MULTISPECIES: alpha-1,4-glucan--maltose-1-phosphate maltosyltransferase [unclassified Pseudomonas]PVZ13515.1 alpha-1,4-glucan:maltose-1-phosphate maltosyltransferase [Pseudomonas sp. URIL14HWK12:I12]PVZ23821.1 alpha-1,4-glucan:maltose-1-phosphate maltosyltransferase [Pseudomonas sp. URIL14HWK12:I10]PVZ33540.1 alpha-1,4-glucan:maltose-1-phosphate maltosyltransferase [Pseudomonas sp. URIL14HWK12:I11]SNZ11963.1 alpha-1,4-glucan:maltose-1-phosphate maltosyltransferase [Pseudomonas sp. URIL14HWK1